jgi:hypothetical protein
MGRHPQMSSDELPRVGVLFSPEGAATLPEIARGAHGTCRPVLLLPSRVAADHCEIYSVARQLFGVRIIDGDLAGVVSELGLAGLTTFNDEYVEPVDTVCATLGLPGVGGLAHPWDKLHQRQVLGEAGLTAVRAMAVDSADDLRAAWTALGCAAVLKPRRGTNGSGVAFLDSSQDVGHQVRTRQRWAGLMLETRMPDGRHPSAGWLADFVSVETINTGDSRRHVAVFDKWPVAVARRAGADGADLVRVAGDVTPSRLPDPDRHEVLAYVQRCLDALQLRWRVTHTEVRLTPNGPELIEVNGRVGAFLNRLLRRIGGVDLVAAALHLAIGFVPEEPMRAVRPGYAMGLFPSFRQLDGMVTSLVTVGDLRALPGVVGVEEVAEAGQPRTANGGRMTNLTLYSVTAVDLDAQVAAVETGLRRLFHSDDPDGRPVA